jgi:hypothetical protein
MEAREFSGGSVGEQWAIRSGFLGHKLWIYPVAKWIARIF